MIILVSNVITFCCVIVIIATMIYFRNRLNKSLLANALLQSELQNERVESFIPKDVLDNFSATRNDIKAALIHVSSIVDCLVFESSRNLEVLHVLIVSENKEEKFIQDANAAVRYVVPVGIKPFIVFLSVNDFDENIISNGLYANKIIGGINEN